MAFSREQTSRHHRHQDTWRKDAMRTEGGTRPPPAALLSTYIEAAVAAAGRQSNT